MAQFLYGVIDTQREKYKPIGTVNLCDTLELELEVRMNGQAIEFVEPSFEFLVLKDDDNKVRQLVDILFEDNKVKIRCNEQVTTYPGTTKGQLIIKDNGRVSTCLFYFIVKDTIEDSIIKSITDVQILDDLDEYVATAFDNLQEYEQRILTGDASIRKLNDDMIAAEKVRDAAEAKRQEDYNTAEADRNTKYTSSETDRDNRYREAEDSREQLYLQEKIDRNNKFNLEKEARENNFNDLKIKMEDATNTSKTEEGKRAVVFSDLREAMEFLKATMTQNNNDMVDNEAERIAAELQRQANFETMQQENNTFKEKIDAQYETIVTENTKFKEDVNAKTGDIEVGYFDNKTYPNGKDRLDADFEDINRRLKEAELLNYNGGVMKCDSSYSGMTSDMLIKGRTLQNLCAENLSINITGQIFYNDLKLCEINKLTVGKKYTVMFYLDYSLNIESSDCYLGYGNWSQLLDPFKQKFKPVKGVNIVHFTITENINDRLFLHLRPYIFMDKQEQTVKVNNVMLFEDEINDFLPYFDGIHFTGENEKVGDKYRIGAKSVGGNFVNIKEYSLTGGNTIYFNLNHKIDKNKKYFLNVKLKRTFSHLSFYLVETPSLKEFHSVGVLSQHIKKIYTPRGMLINYNQIMFYSTDGLSIDDFEFIQFLESEQEIDYVDYVSDEKYILLDEPPRDLPNGTADTVNSLGVESRRIGKIVFNGLENWILDKNIPEKENQITFYTNVSNMIELNSVGLLNFINDKFPVTRETIKTDVEGLSGFGKSIRISIFKNRLATPDIQGFKQWLQANPVTVYYELAEPIIIDHKKNMNLKTFEGVTHITSTNTLQADLSCKVPSNVQAVLQSTRLRNKGLEKELTNTKEKVEVLTVENEEVKAVNETQDILIDTTMLATDEVYTMLEPILEMIPTTIESKERSVSKMVDMYVAMVQRGLKTIEQVPARYREEVIEILAKLGK